MNNLLDNLDPTFKDTLLKLFDILSKKDVFMVPHQGLRGLEEQAKYWRKGRSLKIIESKIKYLRNNKAHYLADIIEKVGPQEGDNIVTNAIPGYSWHNWGLALDCYVSYKGDPRRLIFRDDDPLFKSYASPRYKTFADEAISLGMTAGYYFKKLADLDHIQAFKKEVPKKYSLQYVNDYFKSIPTSKN